MVSASNQSDSIVRRHGESLVLENHDGAAQVDFIARFQPRAPGIAMHLDAHAVAHDARAAIGSARDTSGR